MIDIITDKQSLPALKNDWDRLAARFKSPLLEFDWFMSCLETINKDSEIRIVTVHQHGQLTAIAPLCLTSNHGNTTLEIIGSSTLFEPSGLLYVDTENLKILTQAIAKLKYPVTLLRITVDSSDVDKIIYSNLKHAVTLKKKTATSTYIDIQYDWETFLGKLSSNRRYDFKRKRKRLCKEGKVRVKIFNPPIEELDKHLNSAFVIEDSNWKGRNKSSLLENNALQAFFRNYARKACYNNTLRMCFIYIDDLPVSMHIALLSHNCFWVLKLGYDEALSKCSPGIQLAMDTVEYSFNQKLSRYEFLGSEERWQHAWPVQQHQYCTILIFPFSINGITGLMSAFFRIVKSRFAITVRKWQAPTLFLS